MSYTDDVGKPLRVIHVTQGLAMGGQEKLLVEFARQADRTRFDLQFVSLDNSGILAPDIEAAGWQVIYLNMPAGFRANLILRLSKLFRRSRVDVVHTHEDRQLIHGALAARLARVPLVIHTRHGQSPDLTWRQRTLVNFAASLTDHFICVSQDVARLTSQHGVNPRKTSTIWNGIDLTQFPYLGPNPNGPVVCVARLSPEKGIDTLIRTAALIVRDDPSFQLEIAGDGVSMPICRQLVDELKLTENVHLLGQIRHVSQLLARASVFALPSLSEGISLTILEAMARGLPVVATRVGGNVEVVEDGKTGVLVPAGNPEALAIALQGVRHDPVRGQSMGQFGRQRVERCFDVRRMITAYEKLYEEAVPASQARWLKLNKIGIPFAIPNPF